VERGVLVLKVIEDLSESNPFCLDRGGASGKRSKQRWENYGCHNARRYSMWAVVSRMRRGDIGSFRWRTPVAR
jgi:hypothetical protein